VLLAPRRRNPRPMTWHGSNSVPRYLNDQMIISTMHTSSVPTISKRAGFTLIELLFVIAIIAIFSAMLLPSFSQSKFLSQVTNCTWNFKRWGVMANMYAVDYKEVLPGADGGFVPVGSGENVWDMSILFSRLWLVTD